MTLIHRHLCKRDESWYLLSWDTETHRGSLIIGKQMPRSDGFVSADPSHDGIAIGSLQGIQYFPELRFMGMVMHPVAWDRESSEPILKCRTGKWVERPSDEEAERVIEKTKELGWEWQVNEGGWGRIHVDDLEKIEGPPPDGAF